MDTYNRRILDKPRSAAKDGWVRSLGLAILTIHDDGNLLAVLGGQDVVQESRLACAEISCKPLPSESDPASNTKVAMNTPVTMVMGTFGTGFSSGSSPVPVPTRSGGASSSQSILTNFPFS